MDDHEPMEWMNNSPPSIEALNAAFSKASLSRERVCMKRRIVPAVSSHGGDRRELANIRFMKRRRRVLCVRKLRIRCAVFKCGRNHYTCMSCYKHHSKRCRYCGAATGSVVHIENNQAKLFAKRSESCHEGRGLVVPNHDDNFFCPDGSCGFCGSLDNVLDHVKDAHGSTIIRRFSYGDVMRIPIDLIGKFLILRAEEDGATFVLSIADDDLHPTKLLYVVCADRFTDDREPSKFALDVAQEPSAEESARPYCNTVGSSIVMYGKNVTVREIAGGNSRRKEYRIANSNLGDMETDGRESFLVVPDSCGVDVEGYGDIVLSISDAN